MMQTLCVQSQRYLKTSLQHLITFQHKKKIRETMCANIVQAVKAFHRVSH